MAKKVFEKVDGLGPLDIKKLSAAIRQVWHRSHVRKLVVKRCTGPDGFAYCEKCKEKTPALKIDHINRVGGLLEPDYITRMFTPSSNLQGLCKKCHNEKTKAENAANRKLKVKKPKKQKKIEDFY